MTQETKCKASLVEEREANVGGAPVVLKKKLYTRTVV